MMADLWFVNIDRVKDETVEEHVNRWCAKNKKLVDKVIRIIRPDDDDIKVAVATAVMKIDLFLQDNDSELGLLSKGQFLDGTTMMDDTPDELDDTPTSFYERSRRVKEATRAKAAAKEMVDLLVKVENKMATEN